MAWMTDPSSQKQQRLEEGVGEDMEHAGGKGAHAQRQKHVSQLRNRRVGEHSLDVVLHQRNAGGEKRRQAADDRHDLHGFRRQREQGVAARHHINAGGDHGCRMDQRGDRRGTFHGVRQPDIKRNLRRFTAGSNQQQQGGAHHNGIAD